MGDWTDKDEFLSDIEACYCEAWDKRYSAQSHWNTAYDHWLELVSPCAITIGHILNSLQRVIEAVDYLTCTDFAYEPPFAVPYGFKYLGGEVTWQSIVEAWIKDDFEGRAPTIAVIDRMRQILWDEPFSVVWAARPEIGID